MSTPRTPSRDRIRVLAELTKLDHEERALSMRRNMLHKRIDSLYLAAPLDEDQAAILNNLEELEQEISSERRALHAYVDEVRASIGLPSWREHRDAIVRAS
jgi:predicted transcriptional regulator